MMIAGTSAGSADGAALSALTLVCTPKMITDADEGVEGWIETDDGATALGEPAGSMAWFPGNHHPSDKAGYDIAITAPKDYTAVSNGELTGMRDRGRRATSSWHMGEPVASCVATVEMRCASPPSATTGGAEREVCERVRRDAEPTEQIRKIRAGCGGIYGSPCVPATLKREGVHVGR